jgi:4-hydroxybenzoate polyprenyltransferase
VIIRLQRGLCNVDGKNVAFVIMALATSDEFAVSDYFDHKSDAIATPSRSLPLIRISPTGSAHMSMLLFPAGLRSVLRIAVLEAVVLTNRKMTLYT